jgi:hypothetical protein
MSYQAKILNVFIASPSDMMTERNAIRKILAEWNYANSQSLKIVLLPVSQETHAIPSAGNPQTVINDTLLAECDLLIGVFGQRIGSPTEGNPSGTVEEIFLSCEVGRPTLVYFSNRPVQPADISPEQMTLMREFKEFCKTRYLYCEYNSLDEFERQLFLHIIRLVASMPNEVKEEAVKVSRVEYNPVAALSAEAKFLLVAASNCKEGSFKIVPMEGGSSIIRAGTEIVQVAMDHRQTTRYEAAASELGAYVNFDIMHPDIYALNDSGYKLADLIKKTESP